MVFVWNDVEGSQNLWWLFFGTEEMDGQEWRKEKNAKKREQCEFRRSIMREWEKNDVWESLLQQVLSSRRVGLGPFKKYSNKKKMWKWCRGEGFCVGDHIYATKLFKYHNHRNYFETFTLTHFILTSNKSPSFLSKSSSASNATNFWFHSSIQISCF